MEIGNRKSIANSQVFLNTNENPILSGPFSNREERTSAEGKKTVYFYAISEHTECNEFLSAKGGISPVRSIPRHIAENIEDIFIFGIKFPENPGIDIFAF